jgi:hypothetical protein
MNPLIDVSLGVADFFILRRPIKIAQKFPAPGVTVRGLRRQAGPQRFHDQVAIRVEGVGTVSRGERDGPRNGCKYALEVDSEDRPRSSRLKWMGRPPGSRSLKLQDAAAGKDYREIIRIERGSPQKE